MVVDLVAEGPHVLLAGTTGAGKSEFLRTLVLGLAVRSSPAHLGFVLVDYKGGSAFDACSALPHVLGSVTDFALAFPDVWGLGVAYRSPAGDLTVGFEWDRVEYSVILETLASPLADTSLVAVDDADELHLGVEYVFLDSKPVIAIRGGLWHDPDHRFRFIGEDPFDRALFQPGEDVLHIAIGAGIAFRSFQIDIGADFSDVVDQFVISGIYSF